MRKYLRYLLILPFLFFLKNPFSIENGNILSRPSLIHILGTDNLGRDIYTRLVIGTFNTLIIVFLSMILATLIGVFLGFLSGYFGGIIDNIIQTIIDSYNCCSYTKVWI